MMKAAPARRISAPHATTPHEVVWQALLGECQRLQLARRQSCLNFATGAELWHHITKSSAQDAYGSAGDQDPYVPFEGSQMAEPVMDAAVVPMLSALPPTIAAKYEDVSSMLLPAEEIPIDPKVMGRRYRQVLGKRSEWIAYLQRPEVEALWEPMEPHRVKATLSVAAVPKVGKAGLRKILMSVPFNNLAATPGALMGEEIDYGLTGGAALSQIYVSHCWHTRSLDESNAFTHIVTPPSWWPFMAAPPVRAAELPARWTRGRWKRNQKLYLCYRRLGMGHTHAVFVLLEINKAAVKRAMQASARLSEALLLNDLRDRAFRVALDEVPVVMYIHLDDFIFVSREAALAEEAQTVVAKELQVLGFGVTLADPMATGRYVGYRPTRERPRWEPALVKLGSFARYLDKLLVMQYVNTADVHTAVGIYGWLALLWRPAFSVISVTFRFLEAYPRCRRTLPEAVRAELRAMRDLLPFIFVDLTRPVAPVVLAQDAAGAEAGVAPQRGLKFGAWCIAMAAPPRPEIEEVWRSVEAVGRRGLLPTVRGAMAGSKELAAVATLPRIQRTVVPARWATNATTWHRVLARRWRYPMDICQGELKAAVMWGRLLARSQLCRHMEYLGLGDNQGAVAILGKGRSGRPWYNADVRRLAAFEAVGDFRLRETWVPTWAEAADGGTRPDSSGRLTLGRVLWPGRRTVVLLGPRAAEIRRYMGAGSGATFAVHQDADFGKLLKSATLARRVVRMLESNLVLLAWFTFSDCVAGDPWEAWAARAIVTATRGGSAVVVEASPSSPLWMSPLISAAIETASLSWTLSENRSLLGSSSGQLKFAYSWRALPLVRHSGRRGRNGLDHEARSFALARAVAADVAEGTALVGHGGAGQGST